jgi:galactose mutarotase-like enzyme
MTAAKTPIDQRPAETTAATGDQWVIGHGHQRAIVTEVGATLRSFRVGDRAVVEGFGPTEWSRGGRGQVLAPWPNRLGDGAYTFQGVAAQAPLDEIPRRNAIHGLVRWLPWRLTGRAQNRVGLQCELRPSPAYPFALRLEIEYRLGREGLTVSTDAQNIGEVDLPFGLGFHPYLTVGTSTVDQARLRVPAHRRLVTDERGLPTGTVGVAGTEYDFTTARTLGVTRLDTAFCDLDRDGEGRVRVDLDHPDGAGGVSLWADERFGYLMIYTGDTLDPTARRTGLAVEPMSCPPDAFRSGTDLAVLRPSTRWTGSWGISPR